MRPHNAHVFDPAAAAALAGHVAMVAAVALILAGRRDVA